MDVRADHPPRRQLQIAPLNVHRHRDTRQPWSVTPSAGVGVAAPSPRQGSGAAVTDSRARRRRAHAGPSPHRAGVDRATRDARRAHRRRQHRSGPRALAPRAAPRRAAARGNRPRCRAPWWVDSASPALIAAAPFLRCRHLVTRPRTPSAGESMTTPARRVDRSRTRARSSGCRNGDLVNMPERGRDTYEYELGFRELTDLAIWQPKSLSTTSGTLQCELDRHGNERGWSWPWRSTSSEKWTAAVGSR